MLASAAGRFRDRHIYATGGNDNTVGIWDLTDVTSTEQPPINNGLT
jgi:di- and tripeptidase